MMILRATRRKNRIFILCGCFFIVLQVNVYRSVIIPRKLPCPKKFLVKCLVHLNIHVFCQWQLNHCQWLPASSFLECILSRKYRHCVKKRHLCFRSLILSEKIKFSMLQNQSAREITSLAHFINVTRAVNHRQRYRYAKYNVSFRSVSQLLITCGCSVNLWLQQLFGCNCIKTWHCLN